jgi:hypothetical protein
MIKLMWRIAQQNKPTKAHEQWKDLFQQGITFPHMPKLSNCKVEDGIA